MSIPGQNYDNWIKDFWSDKTLYDPGKYDVPDVTAPTATPPDPYEEWVKQQEEDRAKEMELQLANEQSQTAYNQLNLQQTAANQQLQNALAKQANEISRMNMLARLTQSRQEMRQRMDQSALGNFAISLLGYR